MPTIFDNREAHVLLDQSKTLRCPEENVILTPHNQKAFLLHRAMDVLIREVEERFVQLNPLHVLARGKLFALAPENISTQAMIFTRQNDEAEQPVQGAIGQNMGEQLARLDKPVRASCGFRQK